MEHHADRKVLQNEAYAVNLNVCLSFRVSLSADIHLYFTQLLTITADRNNDLYVMLPYHFYWVYIDSDHIEARKDNIKILICEKKLFFGKFLRKS